LLLPPWYLRVSVPPSAALNPGSALTLRALILTTSLTVRIVANPRWMLARLAEAAGEAYRADRAVGVGRDVGGVGLLAIGRRRVNRKEIVGEDG